MSTSSYTPQRTGMQTHQRALSQIQIQQQQQQQQQNNSTATAQTTNGVNTADRAMIECRCQCKSAHGVQHHPAATTGAANGKINDAASSAVVPCACCGGLPASALSSTSSSPPSLALLPSLLHQLHSLRRELTREHKQRQLVQLSLDESLLQQSYLESLMQQQQVQLATSLELSAALETELHNVAATPPAPLSASPSFSNPAAAASSTPHSSPNSHLNYPHMPPSTSVNSSSSQLHKDLEHIFSKPKKQMESDITTLFATLTQTNKLRYEQLETRVQSEKVTSQSTILKLQREYDVMKQLCDRVRKEKRELQEEHDTMRDEKEKEKDEYERMNKKYQEEISQSTSKYEAEITRLKDELHQAQEELQHANQSKQDSYTLMRASQRQYDDLYASTELIRTRIEMYELTLRHFTCERVRANGVNVSCVICIKKLPHTGEVVLTVRDRWNQGNVNTNTAVTPTITNNNTSTPQTTTIYDSHTELEDEEYIQDITTVRCCAIDGDSSGATQQNKQAVPVVSDDEFVLPVMVNTPSSTASSTVSHLISPLRASISARFVLCFTADSHRCLVFQTDNHEFRQTIVHTLQQFLRIQKDRYQDELNGFWGEQ